MKLSKRRAGVTLDFTASGAGTGSRKFFRTLAILIVTLASAMTVRATTTTIDFSINNAVTGSNTIIFNPNGTGFLDATFSLYSGSTLVATTGPSSSDGLGSVAFGPASDITAFPVSTEVDNIGTLFPLSSTGSIVIQSTGAINLGAYGTSPIVDLSALSGGGGGGSSELITSINTNSSVTPEPASLLLFGTGLLSIGVLLRKTLLT